MLDPKEVEVAVEVGEAEVGEVEVEFVPFLRGGNMPAPPHMRAEWARKAKEEKRLMDAHLW